MSKGKELATIKNYSVAVASVEDWGDELEGFNLQFDRVKIPSGGGNQFEIVRDGDESDFVGDVTGVIIDQHACNAYWRDEFAGQGNQPDCASLDGKYGVGDPGGQCHTCHLNTFGSAANGSGKACKNMRRVYILQEGEAFPLLLTLPPTSAPVLGNFLGKRLLPKGIRRNEAVVKVGLTREKNKAGISYSKATFSLEGKLPADKAAEVEQYSKGIRNITRALEVDPNEYNTGKSNNGNGGVSPEDVPDF